MCKILFSIFLMICTTAHAAIIPIVSVEENDRLEELADETGANEWRFMTKAGYIVGVETEKKLKLNAGSKVIVLVGKGYNGGNALWAGLTLQQKGYNVTALHLFSTTDSPAISQEIMEMFIKAGGILIPFNSSLQPNADIIIDGILGASFKGGATGILADAIGWANESNLPIISVDTPSGINGTTGYVGTVGIHATQTVTFFFPRIGFFVGDGPDHLGALSVVNLGIKSDILSQLNPEAYLVTQDEKKELPLQKPIFFCNSVPHYYISDAYEIYEYFDFLEDYEEVNNQ